MWFCSFWKEIFKWKQNMCREKTNFFCDAISRFQWGWLFEALQSYVSRHARYQSSYFQYSVRNWPSGLWVTSRKHDGQYKWGMNSFQNLRATQRRNLAWPSSNQLLCEYIAYMSLKQYCYSTISGHIAAISYTSRIQNDLENTKQFAK